MPRSAVVLVATSLLVTGLLAGCTSSGSSGATGSTKPATTRASRATATTLISGTVPPYSPKRNARSNVVTLGCVHRASGWSMRGRATNPTSRPRGYSIVVDFITTSGDTVRATKLVVVPPVAPHHSRDWSAANAAPGQAGLTCVIRQVLFT